MLSWGAVYRAFSIIQNQKLQNKAKQRSVQKPGHMI